MRPDRRLDHGEIAFLQGFLSQGLQVQILVVLDDLPGRELRIPLITVTRPILHVIDEGLKIRRHIRVNGMVTN